MLKATWGTIIVQIGLLGGFLGGFWSGEIALIPVIIVILDNGLEEIFEVFGRHA